MSAPRAYVQTERPLLAECLLRLRQYPVIAIVTPNGIPIPVRTPAEATIKARLIRRMKDDGMLLAGAPDMVLLWAAGCGVVELKRPAHKDIFGYHPAGTPSADQQEFARRCNSLGIRHCFANSWPTLQEKLFEWGIDLLRQNALKDESEAV